MVRDLNGRGIPTAEGGKWRIYNFKRLLLRKRDVAFDEFPGKGTRIHKGKEYRAIWNALISKQDHELVVAAFRLQERHRKNEGVVGRTYLLSGKVHCTHTNHGPMYGRGHLANNGEFHRRYGCKAARTYPARTARGRRVAVGAGRVMATGWLGVRRYNGSVHDWSALGRVTDCSPSGVIEIVKSWERGWSSRNHSSCAASNSSHRRRSPP